MVHDVYLCYDEKDTGAGDAIRDIFERNNIGCWAKSRDMSSDNPLEISGAIASSKCLLLILSKNSRRSKALITETDIAFSKNVPILVFKLDDSKLGGNFEFILENNQIIHAFPDYKEKLETLVGKTSDIINRPADNVRFGSNELNVFEKMDPERKWKLVKKYAKIVVPIAVVLILIYFFVILPTGHNTTEDGIFSMNVTGVDIRQSDGENYCTVYGESFNFPVDSVKYFMNLKFFDKEGKMVYEVNSTADEFKSGKIWEGNIHDNEIDHIGFRLTDLNGNLLSEQDYVIE